MFGNIFLTSSNEQKSIPVGCVPTAQWPSSQQGWAVWLSSHKADCEQNDTRLWKHYLRFVVGKNWSLQKNYTIIGGGFRTSQSRRGIRQPVINFCCTPPTLHSSTEDHSWVDFWWKIKLCFATTRQDNQAFKSKLSAMILEGKRMLMRKRRRFRPAALFSIYVYTRASAAATKFKEKIAFAFAFAQCVLTLTMQ